MDKLNKNGYILLKKNLLKNDINFAKKCFNNTKINYKNIELFIKNIFLPKINKKTKLNLKCIKYRASNNNNSVDASGFHRDLRINKNISLPIYTCLCYLDDSIMEIIPKSHNKNMINYIKAFKLFLTKKKIYIKKGDILIFHATLIHRGIFYINQKNRRLLQCFDCIPNDKYDFLKNKIFHLPCKLNCNKIFTDIAKFISKINIIIELINFINYFNVAQGYGLESDIFKKLKHNNKPLNKYYFSTEENTPRLYPKYNNFETGNNYVLLDKNILEWEKKNKNLNFYFLYKNNIKFIIFIIISIYLIRFFKR